MYSALNPTQQKREEDKEHEQINGHLQALSHLVETERRTHIRRRTQRTKTTGTRGRRKEEKKSGIKT